MTEETLKITPVMRRCKAMLHKACPAKTLQTITINDSELPRYIAPTPLPLLKKWTAAQSDFWGWLVTPTESDSDAMHAKELAYAFLVEVLSLPLVSESGVLDPDVLKAKQKAAETLLTKDKPLVSVSNNTLSQHAHMGTLPPGSIPRGLRGKNPAMIESKIASLGSASDSSGDVIDALPNEEDI
jgi:hypothetical protein